MLLPAVGGPASNDPAGPTNASVPGKTLTSNASANTKGSWVSIIDPVPYDVGMIEIVLFLTQGSVGEFLVDIGIANTGGGDETVLIPDLLASEVLSLRKIGPNVYVFPLYIPAGVRLVGRCQDDVGSNTIIVSTVLSSLSPYGPRPFKRCTAYGVNASLSMGTAVDAGGTANTRVVTQLDASCANPLKAAIVVHGANNNFPANADFLWSLTAGAGDEDVIPTVHTATSIASFTTQIPGLPFPCDIPAATKLGIALQSTTTDTNDRILDFTIYGLD